MHLRSAVCVTLFVVAYILLIPGLTCLLFSAKASFMGMTIVDMEKSTFGAIHLLMEKGRYVAALTILICSVIAPFVKLVVLLVCAYHSSGQEAAGPRVSSAIESVRRISKWATVDAFTASIFVGFFCNNPVLQVNLHKGFYCFMGYCIFSVAGALVLEKPEQPLEEQRRPMPIGAAHARKSILPAIAGSIMLLGFLVALLLLPIFHVECSMLFLKEQLSFIDIVQRLGQHGSLSAALSLAALAALVPAADFVWTTVEATMGRIEHPAGEWLQDFAMFDVFALAVVVVTSAAAGVNDNLHVTMLPGGWLLCFCATAWVVYSLTLRSRPVAQSHSLKDKLGGSVMEDIESVKLA